MTKAIIHVGWDEYVVDLEDAVTHIKMMATAERYTSKGYGEDTTYHVWDERVNARGATLTILPESTYHAGKMAGKPEAK